MRRLLSVPILVVFLVAWVLSPGSTPPVQALALTQDVPTADILRGPYEAPAPVVAPLADVLRGPYEEALPALATVPTADVLRGPYRAMPLVQAPMPLLVRGEQPLADVLRGPYEYAVPATVVTTPSILLAWIVAGSALTLLLLALALDFMRRARVSGRAPRGGGQPLEHPH